MDPVQPPQTILDAWLRGWVQLEVVCRCGRVSVLNLRDLDEAAWRAPSIAGMMRRRFVCDRCNGKPVAATLLTRLPRFNGQGHKRLPIIGRPKRAKP